MPVEGLGRDSLERWRAVEADAALFFAEQPDDGYVGPQQHGQREKAEALGHLVRHVAVGIGLSPGIQGNQAFRAGAVDGAQLQRLQYALRLQLVASESVAHVSLGAFAEGRTLINPCVCVCVPWRTCCVQSGSQVRGG